MRSYSHSLVTQAKRFSVRIAIYRAIAKNYGCLMERVGKSNSYTLYYNDPRQLAQIGTDLGKYHSKGGLYTPH